MASDDLTSQITDLEQQTWRALQKSGDDFLPFLSPDCVMLFPLGLQVSHTTEPSLGDILTADAFVPWERYTMRDVTVTPTGGGGAAISYRVKATRRGTGEFNALISSVWRKESEGGFKLCLHQQTPFELEVDDIDENVVA